MTRLEWVTAPPAVAPRKVEVVAAQLRAKPGQWALIARGAPILSAWWAPLHNSDDFEVESRKSDPSGPLFSPVDVYARYIGEAAR